MNPHGQSRVLVLQTLYLYVCVCYLHMQHSFQHHITANYGQDSAVHLLKCLASGGLRLLTSYLGKGPTVAINFSFLNNSLCL